jgi:hypothetical protein
MQRYAVCSLVVALVGCGAEHRPLVPAERQRPTLSKLVPPHVHVERVRRAGSRDLVITYRHAFVPGSSEALRGLVVWHHGRRWTRALRFRRVADDFLIQVQDVTRDGRPDVLLFEDRDGSGGCGIWRVFVGGREQFVRAGCRDNATVRFEGHRVVAYRGVVRDPRSGTYIHCCWSRWRRTAFRWDGDRFQVEARRIGPPPRASAFWRG